MKCPDRIATRFLDHSGIDAFFKKFFKRCAEPTEITDEEFAAYTRECFNHTLSTHYGTAGYNYLLETQDKFHDS